jgi:hypothetical protein
LLELAREVELFKAPVELSAALLFPVLFEVAFPEILLEVFPVLLLVVFEIPVVLSVALELLVGLPVVFVMLIV